MAFDVDADDGESRKKGRRSALHIGQRQERRSQSQRQAAWKAWRDDCSEGQGVARIVEGRWHCCSDDDRSVDQSLCWSAVQGGSLESGSRQIGQSLQLSSSAADNCCRVIGLVVISSGAAKRAMARRIVLRGSPGKSFG